MSQFVAEACNLSVPAHHPYTGASAFAHKGGLHASAIARFPEAYEHTRPESVGNAQRMLVSELAGKASLVAEGPAGLGIRPGRASRADAGHPRRHQGARGAGLLLRGGRRFAGACCCSGHLGAYRPHFTLESFRVIVDDHEDTGALCEGRHVARPPSRSTWAIERFVATGEGTGPVGALDNALRTGHRARSILQVADMELVDYKVRILDENVGTGRHHPRRHHHARQADGTWGTVGVSENIIEASWNALVDSIDTAS